MDREQDVKQVSGTDNQSVESVDNHAASTTGSVVSFPGSRVTPLPTKSKPSEPVDQIATRRERSGYLAHNAILAEKRQARIKAVANLMASFEDKLPGIEQIQHIENKLAAIDIDTAVGQKLQYDKMMACVFYGLPLEYIQADSLSSQIEMTNHTLADLSRLAALLPADDPESQKQQARIEALQRDKLRLVNEMEANDTYLFDPDQSVTVEMGMALLKRTILTEKTASAS